MPNSTSWFYRWDPKLTIYEYPATKWFIKLFIDSSKAFDTVPHRLLNKLKFYGIQGSLLQWISSWHQRHQRVIVDGESSSVTPVKSGVLQGTVLGPLMFLISCVYQWYKGKYYIFGLTICWWLLFISLLQHYNIQDAKQLQEDLRKICE